MTASRHRVVRVRSSPRTHMVPLPPSARSRVGLGLTAGAARGRLELQVCRVCATVQYPPREACHRCLSTQLDWKPQRGDGDLLAETTLHHSSDEYFRERLPWRLGLIRLDCGPTVLAHLHAAVSSDDARARVGARLDRAGQAALVAFPCDEVSNMADDNRLREMTCEPSGRKVLVTDGRTAVGQAMVHALLAAGADLVWAGCADLKQRSPELEALARLPRVTLLPLDVTSADSVGEAAAGIGASVDILINNAEHHRSQGVAMRQGMDTARVEMDVNYFGPLRLAQAFGPSMRQRQPEVGSSMPAWVNLLSVYALANLPAQGTYCASKAAAYSLAQCQRAEMQAAGVRVVNVFPGPIDDETNKKLLPPKLSPEALAGAIVTALQQGIEDVYPGDFAEEWHARWRDDPKVLERELAAAR
jgi:NAD(P)-dependent dehydrogenase (short-subunit alcohol dehydrogenase family)/uncharacterized OB-fold protein